MNHRGVIIILTIIGCLFLASYIFFIFQTYPRLSPISYYDTFESSDGNQDLKNSLGSGGLTWTTLQGAWEVVSGGSSFILRQKISANPFYGNSTIIADQGESWQAYNVVVNLSESYVSGDETGVLLLVKDSTHYYVFVPSYNNSAWLYKVDGNQRTLLGKDTSKISLGLPYGPLASSWTQYNLKVLANETENVVSITLMKGNVSLTFVDCSPSWYSGTMGFRWTGVSSETYHPIAIETVSVSSPSSSALPHQATQCSDSVNHKFTVDNRYEGGCNDDWSGSETHPWCTLSKAAALVQAGDIVHVKEGVYREIFQPINSGTAQEPITFIGEDAVIDGSDILGSWREEGDGVYSAPLSYDPLELYQDGERWLVKARYPGGMPGNHTSWARPTLIKITENSSQADKVTSEVFSLFSSQDLIGAYLIVHIRVPNSLEGRTITSIDGNTVTVDSPYSYTPQAYRETFFIENSRAFMTQEGTFVYRDGRVFVKAYEKINLIHSPYILSASKRPYVFFLEATGAVQKGPSFIIVQGFTFRNTQGTALHSMFSDGGGIGGGCAVIESTEGAVFNNNTLINCAGDGIGVGRSYNLTLSNNLIRHAWSAGISLGGGGSYINTGTTSSPLYSFVGVKEDGNLVDSNVIESVGDTGMNLAYSYGSVIRNNIILAQGGERGHSDGLQYYINKNVLIEGNTIYNDGGTTLQPNWQNINVTFRKNIFIGIGVRFWKSQNSANNQSSYLVEKNTFYAPVSLRGSTIDYEKSSVILRDNIFAKGLYPDCPSLYTLKLEEYNIFIPDNSTGKNVSYTGFIDPSNCKIWRRYNLSEYAQAVYGGNLHGNVEGDPLFKDSAAWDFTPLATEIICGKAHDGGDIGAVACQLCGDNIKEGSEECDGSDFGLSNGGSSCSLYNSEYTSGSLLCSSCYIDTSNCAKSSGSETPSGGDRGEETSCSLNWTCTNWSACANEQKVRVCSDSEKCGKTAGKPHEIESCSCTENWICDEFNNINENGNRCGVRNCIDNNSCGTYDTKPDTELDCVGKKLPDSDNVFWKVLIIVISISIIIVVVLIYMRLNKNK